MGGETGKSPIENILMEEVQWPIKIPIYLNSNLTLEKLTLEEFEPKLPALQVNAQSSWATGTVRIPCKLCLYNTK